MMESQTGMDAGDSGNRQLAQLMEVLDDDAMRHATLSGLGRSDAQ